MYNNNAFADNSSKLNKELFDVNRQIASGLQIQYASDDISTFTETMRLDNELTTIGQAKTSTESGYKISNQTDVTMNEYTDSMNRMRTLLVQAGNGTNDDTSLDAIVGELKGLEKNLKSISNTSVNGQYLFSGSAVDVKPIADDGTYQGNDTAMNSFVGSNNFQQYNITGADLFLGEEGSIEREITTNVVNDNLLNDTALTPSSTISEYMGDKDTDKLNQSHFYVRGTKSDGTSFKDRIDLNEDTTMQDLMDHIETDYGDNTVNVKLNDSGQIIVEDKQNGSSKLDFHMISAVDYNSDYTSGTADPADRAIVTDIDDLDDSETNYDDATATDVFVRESVRSGLDATSSAAQNIEGIVYDRVDFKQEGSTLTSSMPQILKKTNYAVEGKGVADTISKDRENSFATPSTKLSEVADAKKETDPATTPATYTLDGTTFNLEGKDINGSDYTAKINLRSVDDGGSYFSVDTDGDGTVDTDYTMYNVDGSLVDPDKMTYQQFMDVSNMVVTNTLPPSDGADVYHATVKDASFLGDTSLTYDGKIEFKDLTSASTAASMALYDENSDDFSKDASVMTFNTNNALTIRDPKTDFFKTLDDIIKSVENYSSNPDANGKDVRNVGIENSIAMMDDLLDHTYRTQSVAGSQSNSLSTSLERTQLLEVSTMSLRSSVIDTDLAESSLRLSQLTTNYDAMLSTVGKVSKLSLVNYL
jgi:flagellar hook-associated protein 3 FlgL